MFGTKLTPEQKLARDQARARERREAEARRAERRRLDAIEREERAQQEKERIAAFPHFIVRQTREVTVQADNMEDAIALASAAFKEGQDDDHTIKWHKPFGVDGDTVDAIRVVNVKAVESQFD